MYVKFSAFCDLLQKQIRKTRNQCANIVLIRSRFIYSPFALNHIHTHSFYFWHCYYCTWLFFFFLIPLEPCAFYFARDLLLCDSEWRFALESDTIDGTVSFCSSTRYQEKFKLCISSNSKFSYEICILWWKKKSSEIISFPYKLIWFLYILIPGKKQYTYFYTEMCVCYYPTKGKNHHRLLSRLPSKWSTDLFLLSNIRSVAVCSNGQMRLRVHSWMFFSPCLFDVCGKPKIIQNKIKWWIWIVIDE